MPLSVLDSTGATKALSTTVDTGGTNLVGATALADPNSGQKAQVAAFHNADNQNPGGTAFGLLTGGVAQLLNAAGFLDRAREGGIDQIAAVGLAAGTANFGMAFKTSVAVSSIVGTVTMTPAAMSGTIGGVPWKIQAGTVLLVDVGAQQENVVVTAVAATTFTAVFAKTHTGPFTVIGKVYNEERDAAGEADGASGIGTAVAAEYEFNGGGPGSANFDRARSVQAKGRTTAAISAGGGAGSTSLTVAAAGTIKAGMQVTLLKSSTFPAAGSFESIYVDLSYSEGTTTVPLTTAIVNAVTYDTIAYDAFMAGGPGLNGFNCTGVGIEEEALYDPVSGLFFIERASTQDAMAAANIVAENPALFNGTTMDRARAAPGGLGVAAVSSDGIKTTYRWAILAIAPVATPTDFVVIQGSATKTLRIKRVKLSGVATGQGNMPVQLVRRSTGGTLGTAMLTAIVPAKHDVNDAAATAVVSTVSITNYTTLGTTAGVAGSGRLGMPPITTGATGQDIVWDFCTRQDKAIILRGASDFLNINLNGAAVPAGAVIDIEIEGEEDNS